MYVGMCMAFPTSSLHASLFYKSLRFALAFTLKLYNYVASFFPQPTVFTFASLTCTRSSPHTRLLHSPHVVLRQCLLDWATERLVASFPLVPWRNVPHPKGLAAHFPIGPRSGKLTLTLKLAYIFPCKAC